MRQQTLRRNKLTSVNSFKLCFFISNLPGANCYLLEKDIDVHKYISSIQVFQGNGVNGVLSYFNKFGWMPRGNSRPRCSKDCHHFLNHSRCSMLRSVIRYDWTKCIRPENVQQNQIMFMLFCQGHWTTPNQDKFRKKKLIS